MENQKRPECDSCGEIDTIEHRLVGKAKKYGKAYIGGLTKILI